MWRLISYTITGSVQGHGKGFEVAGAGKRAAYSARSRPHTGRRKLDEAPWFDVGIKTTFDNFLLYCVGKSSNSIVTALDLDLSARST